MYVTYSKLGQHGQFGNQLWQIAVVLHYAQRYGHRPVLPRWRCFDTGRIFEEIFPRIREVADFGESFDDAVIYQQRSFRFEELPEMAGNVDLVGGFQSYKFLTGTVLDLVRRVVTSSNPYQEEADRVASEELGGNYGAIHVRFYQDLQRDIGRGQMEKLPWAYYRNVLARFDKSRPIYVASDDVQRAVAMLREVASESRQLVYATSRDQLADFYLLSGASALAISNSTFSYWAALLKNGAKRVFAPQRYFWFDRATRAGAFWNTSDLYPVAFEEIVCVGSAASRAGG